MAHDGCHLLTFSCPSTVLITGGIVATAGQFAQWYFGAYSMYPSTRDLMGPGLGLFLLLLGPPFAEARHIRLTTGRPPSVVLEARVTAAGPLSRGQRHLVGLGGYRC
jgi:hypothetical protein